MATSIPYERSIPARLIQAQLIDLGLDPDKVVSWQCDAYHLRVTEIGDFVPEGALPVEGLPDGKVKYVRIFKVAH